VEATTAMSKLISAQELEGRMDCFGEFDSSDMICLKNCGINIACANAKNMNDDLDWTEEEVFGLPDVTLD
jgi:hypothetical protein